MRFRAVLVTLALALALAPGVEAQKITFKTVPAGAEIWLVSASGSSTLLGKGTAKHKLVKKEPNRIVVKKEGWQSVERDFAKAAAYFERVCADDFPQACRLAEKARKKAERSKR